MVCSCTAHALYGVSPGLHAPQPSAWGLFFPPSEVKGISGFFLLYAIDVRACEKTVSDFLGLQICGSLLLCVEMDVAVFYMGPVLSQDLAGFKLELLVCFAFMMCALVQLLHGCGGWLLGLSSPPCLLVRPGVGFRASGMVECLFAQDVSFQPFYYFFLLGIEPNR